MVERELFVVSDLHLGGRQGSKPGDRGFCLNPYGAELASFVRSVASRTAARAVELVINGDIVDFLAIEGSGAKRWRPFIDEPAEALAAMQQVFDQEADFFGALAELLQAGADLTLVLGNHDVELGLPAVRAALADRLEPKRGGGRLRFVVDGEAYVVGDVLIEHGNRYDGFNKIEYEELLALRSWQSRRMPIPDEVRFHAPPGSHMVAEVMNPIKSSYSFVDLLKPEIETVVPLLLALEPGLAGDIERIWRLWSLRRQANARQASEPGRPSGKGLIGIETAAADTSLRGLLGPHMDAGAIERLLDLTQRVRLERESEARRIGLSDQARWRWSVLKLTLGSPDWVERRQILLDALRTLQHDRTFDPAHEEPAYLDHASRFIGAGFKVVVFGHTHLAKQVAVPSRQGQGLYLNTGTWADLMRLPAGLFNADAQAALAEVDRFAEALRANRLQPYLCRMPSYAHLRVDGAGRVLGAALHRADQADPRTL